jgi:uncharacterized SAM-binding protein YcdF (DUF218 family)
MVVVVLGHRLESPQIHARLRARVVGGMRALDADDESYLLCTGGQTNPEVDRTECGVMGEYAVRRGVDPDRIVLDPFAYDTIGNAYFSRVLLDDVGLDPSRVHLVTDDFHAPRAKCAFGHCFGPDTTIDTTYSVETERDAHSPTCREKLQQTRRFFEPVPVADTDAIRRRLHADHDCYDFSETLQPISQ